MRTVFRIDYLLRGEGESIGPPRTLDISTTGICSADACDELLETAAAVCGFEADRFINMPAGTDGTITKIATIGYRGGRQLVLHATFEPYLGWDCESRQHHMYRDRPDTDLSQFRRLLRGLHDARFGGEGDLLSPHQASSCSGDGAP